jgi:branched-chain amino acid transport system permease protein
VQFLIHHFFELTITGLAFGSIYALIALGYTMVYGVLQLINFAHSEVFMFGTFAAAWTVTRIHGTNSVSQGLGSTLGLLAAATLAAMLMSATVALVLERVAYRPLIKRNAPKLIALISAIGASFALSEAMGLRDKIAQGVHVHTLGMDFQFPGLAHKLDSYVTNARNTYSSPVTVQPNSHFSIFGHHFGIKIGDYRVTDVDLLVIVAAVLMMVLLDFLIRRTHFGRGIRAIAQDPESAALMGVNSTKVIRLTFLIGGLMAGIAASLYMLRIGTTSSGAGFQLGVKAFTAAVLGGIGNLRGALLGGLILGVAENWGSAVFGSNWLDVFSFSLLVLILLVRPSGLLGEALGKARA